MAKRAKEFIVTGVTTQLATSAITGNSFKLDTDSLVKGAVSAGVMSYASSMIDSSLNLENLKVADMSYSQQLQQGVSNTVVKSAIDSAIYGTDFKDNLLFNAGNTVQGKVSNIIGDNYINGELNYTTHKLAHLASGAIVATIRGEDLKSGALGAVTGEVIGGAVGTNLIKDGDFTQSDEKIVKLSSSLGTIFTAEALGKDAKSALNSSDVAVDNNVIYTYRKKVVATDGVNDHMVVDLNSKEVIEKGLYLNTYIKGRIQNIASEDISKYDNVYNLTNQEDLETLRQGTDMIYDNINKDTKIVMITGMNNDFKSAKNIQNNILGKDFNNVGLINNQTDKTFGVLGDILEWTPNYLTTKDVLNAEMLQRLSPNTLVVTHSAGNPDIKKANQVNELVGAKTPYLHYSVASPESATNLESSDSKVGAIFIKQTNHPNDPVANGWLNKDANYEYRGIIKTYIDLINSHPFENYYNNGVREDINKVLNHE